MVKPTTEKALTISLWWWRRTRFLFPLNSFDPNWHERREWEDGLEQTAFEYELVRRVCRTRTLPPFVELDGWIQAQLHFCFCRPRKRPTKVMSAVSVWHRPIGEQPTRLDQGNLVPHGLSCPDAEGWSLNLNVTDNQLLEYLRISKLPDEAELNAYLVGDINREQFQETLCSKKAATPSKSQFLAEINRQRAIQGIKPPRGLKGQRNRRISWNWIELLDLAEFKIKRPLKDTDSERQTRRRARVRARKLLPKYLEALEKFENSPRRPKEKVRPKPLLRLEG